MIDPSGHKETVYVFDKMVVNKPSIFTIFGRKWWDIDLTGYKIINMGDKPVATRKKPITKRPKNLLPNLAGYSVKDAERHLKQLGLKVEFVNGRLAKSVKEVDHIESQFPGPYTRFRPGQTVVLARFVDPSGRKPADYREVPNLRHLGFKQARKQLKDLGFQVEFRKGSVATKSNLKYAVQYQFPLTKGKTLKGSKFILTLYMPQPDRQPRSRTSARPNR